MKLDRSVYNVMKDHYYTVREFPTFNDRDGDVSSRQDHAGHILDELYINRTVLNFSTSKESSTFIINQSSLLHLKADISFRNRIFDKTSTTMKTFQTLFIAGASLFLTSQAYVVELYGTTDCTGASTSRNVYDNTCAYTQGFQSLKLTTNGGGTQQLIAYSPQACAGTQNFHGCAAGVDCLKIGECHKTTDGSGGGSNALSSYSNGAYCPN